MSDHKISENKFLIVLAGPTAVGKTAVAIQLAQDLQCEIFSADSRQIYREMSIGTAKPNDDELMKVKHHFINHISIHQAYTVGHYVKEVNEKLEAYFEDQDIAILTGGTGMYINALLHGIDDFPDVDSATHKLIVGEYEEKGIEWLQQQVASVDPIYYNEVDVQNPRRLLRALEIYRMSGKPYSTFLKTKNTERYHYHVVEILLEMPREELYHRINTRVENMMVNGLESEARALYQFRGIKALDTVGYRELFSYFDGTIDINRAVELIKQNSRRYAKRQMTWFKKYGNWSIFNPKHYSEILDYVRNAIS
ncbi:MAG: tRNA (adenosine(37)-N6)-dimethylallyltransferase MiaA [Saprospiraceae bacterium]|nr:tRNA (adenosine(37)-N6)-dimethylallyltransferase MiaA [Saprospiraceae bacterium]MCZ2338206.1 tRNA (adenosine(37)-N6)-dimethylallyltransferase MiaA [Chitinophagales bacterium]